MQDIFLIYLKSKRNNRLLGNHYYSLNYRENCFSRDIYIVLEVVTGGFSYETNLLLRKERN